MAPKRPYAWYMEQLAVRRAAVAFAFRKKEEHAAECETVGKCNTCLYYHANHQYENGDLKKFVGMLSRVYPHGRP